MSPQAEGTGRPSWPKRIGWLLVLWAAGVLALGLVAGLLRVVMTAAGLAA
jgi:hypothetical protein